MRNRSILSKDLEKIRKSIVRDEIRNMVIFVGSEDVCMNGEWFDFNQFKEKYPLYITEACNPYVIGWEKNASFPKDWEIITFLDEKMSEAGNHENIVMFVDDILTEE